MLLCCRLIHLVSNLLKSLKSYVLEFSLEWHILDQTRRRGGGKSERELKLPERKSIIILISHHHPFWTLIWSPSPSSSLNIQAQWANRKARQHCRLSICSYFGWLWQILNLRRAGMSTQSSRSSMVHHCQHGLVSSSNLPKSIPTKCTALMRMIVTTVNTHY